MLKRLLGALLGLVLWGGTAMAQCTSGLTTLVNGTTADATAVMGNFNALNDCAAPLASPAFTGGVSVTTTSAGGPDLNLLNGSVASTHGLFGASYPPNGTMQQPNYTYFNAGSGISINANSAPILFGLGWTETLRVANGDVGVNMAATSFTYNFQVNGSAGGNNGWSVLSDERLKTNVTPITDALGLVKRLRGVRYQWRAIEDRAIGKELTLSDGPQIGLIAQEVAAVVPEAVVVPAKGSTTPYGLKSADLIPILVEAVKQQQAEIEQLRASLAALKAGKTGGQ